MFHKKKKKKKKKEAVLKCVLYILKFYLTLKINWVLIFKDSPTCELWVSCLRV